jgi:hypothetical protein
MGTSGFSAAPVIRSVVPPGERPVRGPDRRLSWALGAGARRVTTLNHAHGTDLSGGQD